MRLYDRPTNQRIDRRTDRWVAQNLRLEMNQWRKNQARIPAKPWHLLRESQDVVFYRIRGRGGYGCGCGYGCGGGREKAEEEEEDEDEELRYFIFNFVCCTSDTWDDPIFTKLNLFFFFCDNITEIQAWVIALKWQYQNLSPILSLFGRDDLWRRTRPIT